MSFEHLNHWVLHNLLKNKNRLCRGKFFNTGYLYLKMLHVTLI